MRHAASPVRGPGVLLGVERCCGACVAPDNPRRSDSQAGARAAAGNSTLRARRRVPLTCLASGRGCPRKPDTVFSSPTAEAPVCAISAAGCRLRGLSSAGARGLEGQPENPECRPPFPGHPQGAHHRPQGKAPTVQLLTTLISANERRGGGGDLRSAGRGLGTQGSPHKKHESCGRFQRRQHCHRS